LTIDAPDTEAGEAAADAVTVVSYFCERLLAATTAERCLRGATWAMPQAGSALVHGQPPVQCSTSTRRC
jgi:hypothetical protein